MNVRAANLLLAATGVACPHCVARAPVFALMVPPAHETRESNDGPLRGDFADGVWQRAPYPAFLFYVAQLDGRTLQRLARLAPSCWFDAAGQSEAYWCNHCANCDFAWDDQDLFCEPGAAFLPTDGRNAALIELVTIDRAFHAAYGGYCADPEFFDAMTAS